tara:strand:- start:487 stop:660 length:174 start_codon:yes stop_codon:yes gene_type:complete
MNESTGFMSGSSLPPSSFKKGGIAKFKPLTLIQSTYIKLRGYPLIKKIGDYKNYSIC